MNTERITELFEQEIRVLTTSYRSVLHKNVNFIDLNPIFADPYKLRILASVANAHLCDFHVVFNKIVAPEARGFILPASLAIQNNCGFIPIRKEGKLPQNQHVLSYRYTTEYSEDTLEVDTSFFNDFDKILVYDDVLATGGTALACRGLCNKADLQPHFLFLVEIEALGGRSNLIKSGIPDEYIKSIIKI